MSLHTSRGLPPHVLAAGQGAFLGRLLNDANTPDYAVPAQKDNIADGLVHHIELWVPDLNAACAQWAPVLEALGCQLYQTWDRGRSWRRGGAYLVLEQSRDLIAEPPYDRMRAGLNHLALRGTPAAVDAALAAGWALRVTTDTACHLVNSDGFELEIVTGQQEQ